MPDTPASAVSLHFTETLRGSYFLVESPDDVRLCEVQVQVRLQRPRALERRFVAAMTGSTSFDGLCAAVPIEGQLRFELVRPRRVSYEFAFVSQDGRILHFRGAKHPSLMRPLYSATTLWGTLSEGERAIAMVRLHFDLRRDLVAFLQSVAREADGQADQADIQADNADGSPK